MKQVVYITLANLKAITRRSKLAGLDIAGRVWKREIYFFNQYEKNALIAIQHLLANPEDYFTEVYIPYKPTDGRQFVHEGISPAYHSSNDCVRLHSDYENYAIPEEIKRRGGDEISRFRRWFKSNERLLEDKPDLFLFRLKNEFQIKELPEYVKYENSGYIEHEDMSIEDLEARIDSRIKEAGRFYYASDKNNLILRAYSKHAFRGFQGKTLPKAIPGYSEEEVKEFLREYEQRFKQPLQADLIEYYRLDLNPEIEMSGHILDRVGFKPCKSCYEASPAAVKEGFVDDDIPF